MVKLEVLYIAWKCSMVHNFYLIRMNSKDCVLRIHKDVWQRCVLQQPPLISPCVQSVLFHAREIQKNTVRGQPSEIQTINVFTAGL